MLKLIKILLLFLSLNLQAIVSLYILKDNSGHYVMLLGDAFRKETSGPADYLMKQVIENSFLHNSSKIKFFIEAQEEFKKQLMSNESLQQDYSSVFQLLKLANNPKNTLEVINSDYRSSTLSEGLSQFLQDFSIAIKKINGKKENAIEVNLGKQAGAISCLDYLIYNKLIRDSIHQTQNLYTKSEQNKVFLSLLDEFESNRIQILGNLIHAPKDEPLALFIFKLIASNALHAINHKNKSATIFEFEKSKRYFADLKDAFDNCDQIFTCTTVLHDILKNSKDKKTICLLSHNKIQQIRDCLINVGYNIIEEISNFEKIDGINHARYTKEFYDNFDRTIYSFFADPSLIDRKIITCTQCQAIEKDTKFKICSRCKLANYCSIACQKAHWNTHKLSCAAVKVKV